MLYNSSSDVPSNLFCNPEIRMKKIWATIIQWVELHFLLHCLRLTFLFIHLQGALAQSSHSGLQITKHKFSSLPLTQSPHPTSLDCRARWSVFREQEHLRYRTRSKLCYFKRVTQAGGYFLWKWRLTGEYKLQDKYFTYAEASVLPPRPPQRTCDV